MSVAENAAGGIKSGVLLPLVLFLLFLAGAAMIAAGAFLVKSCGKKDQKVRFVPARMDNELLDLWNAPCNTPYFKK